MRFLEKLSTGKRLTASGSGDEFAIGSDDYCDTLNWFEERQDSIE
jgi:hypothetical protein